MLRSPSSSTPPPARRRMRDGSKVNAGAGQARAALRSGTAAATARAGAPVGAASLPAPACVAEARSPLRRVTPLTRWRHGHARVGRHLFHSTARREILPLLGLAAVAVVGRYSYRALRRMDEEWDEYQFDLEKYNEKHGIRDDSSSSAGPGAGSATFSGSVMGVDVGSSNVRISHLVAGGSGNPEVVEDRQGFRSTPSLVILGDDVDVTGRLARARLHERKHAGERVLNPQSLLLGGLDDDIASRAYRAAVQPIALNTAEKVGEGRGGGAGAAFGPDVLPVFTYPPSFLMPRGTSTATDFASPEDEATGLPMHAFRAVASSLSSPIPPAFVAEPVAAVEAARFLDLLPPPPPGVGDDGAPVLVLDAGASYLATSLVTGDSPGYVAFHSRCDGAGADVLLDAVVNILCRDFYGSESSHVSDGMALQRMYDAADGAVAELSAGMTRSRVNVPYLSMDTGTHEPRHLDVEVTAFALANEVDSMVASSVVNSSSSALSSTLPDPKNLSDLMSSVVTGALEEAQMTPFQLRGALLVGGGGRSPVFRNAARDGLARVAGTQFAAERLVVPPGELVEELTVIGAALMGGRRGGR